MDTARAASRARRQSVAAARLGVGLEGEGNEVADFFDQLAERVARRLLRRCAQLLGAQERAVAPVQEGAHVYGGRLGGGDRCGRATQELRERRRADSSSGEALVGGP